MLFLTGFSLGCIAITSIIVVRDFWQHSVAKAFLAMILSASALLIRPHLDPEYRWLASDIMTMLPALFWLVCQLAFARRPQLRSVWSIIALYSFIAPAVTRGLESTVESTGLNLFGWRIPQYCEYLLILNGLWAIVASWRDDLIDSRRKFRAAMLVTLGSTGLWVTLSLNTGNGDSSSIYFAVALCSLVVGFLLLEGREGVLLGVKTVEETTPLTESPLIEGAPDEKPKNDLTQSAVILEKVMNDEKFYRTEKLTLSMLATEICLPEYKTRALINQTFNYRNFNDYINQLRIEEASDRLIAEPETPIQNIALDVGYRTLSSFNRAFKEIIDQTPTEFRNTKP